MRCQQNKTHQNRLDCFYLCPQFTKKGCKNSISNSNSACHVWLFAPRPVTLFCLGAAANHLCTPSPVVKLASADLRGCVCSQFGSQLCSGFGARLGLSLLPVVNPSVIWDWPTIAPLLTKLTATIATTNYNYTARYNYNRQFSDGSRWVFCCLLNFRGLFWPHFTNRSILSGVE